MILREADLLGASECIFVVDQQPERALAYALHVLEKLGGHIRIWKDATDRPFTAGQVLTLLGILVVGASFERVVSRPTAAS
jgi:hypothetical protein